MNTNVILFVVTVALFQVGTDSPSEAGTAYANDVNTIAIQLAATMVIFHVGTDTTYLAGTASTNVASSGTTLYNCNLLAVFSTQKIKTKQ